MCLKFKWKVSAKTATTAASHLILLIQNRRIQLRSAPASAVAACGCRSLSKISFAVGKNFINATRPAQTLSEDLPQDTPPRQRTKSPCPCIVVDCRRPYLEFNLSYDCADPLVVLTLHMMLLLFCLWPGSQAAVSSFWWSHGHVCCSRSLRGKRTQSQSA